jgi:hypothetical protein
MLSSISLRPDGRPRRRHDGAEAAGSRSLTRINTLLCAVLLALFPLLSLFAHNQSEVELSVLWWPVALCVVVTVAMYGIFLLITKRADKAGVLAALVVFAFFYFGLFAGSGHGWFLAVWVVVFLAVAVAVVRTRRDLLVVTLILGVAAAVMTVPPTASIVIYHVRHPSLSASDPRLWPTALPKPVVPVGTRPPDIYVLMPDDYARADILKQYFHYDDSEFIDQLKARGFVISEQGRSPYSDSESNMASLLNMDYLGKFPAVLGKTSQDVRPVKRVMQDNRAARLLTSLGYDYVHLDTDEVTFAGSNPDISPLAPPDSLMNLWLENSAFRLMGGPLGFNQAARNARFRTSIHSVFSQLAAVRPERKPKFVVFHTLLPHDPYLFGAQGQPVTFPGRTEEDLANKLGRTYYLHQLEYLHQLLLDSVDQILAHAKTPPVILISADEGFQANPEPFGEAAMQDIRVKGLGAFYLPDVGQPGVPNPPNTVNSLRFVLNHYLGTQYPMLRSASYPEGDLPYDFKELPGK